MIPPYGTSLQHIFAELERIDLLIQSQVGRARQTHLTDEAFQGLYIAEEEVDALLSEPAGLPRWAAADLPLASSDLRAVLDRIKSVIAQRQVASVRCGITLRLDELARHFDLSPSLVWYLVFVAYSFLVVM